MAPDLAGWVGTQRSAESGLSGSLQALGSPFLSWSPATSHLDLTREAPAGG